MNKCTESSQCGTKFCSPQGSCVDCLSDNDCPQSPQQQVCVNNSCSLKILDICGDGKRTSEETCDDGNILDNDGCSFDCHVEAGYICTGGGPESKDTCGKIVITQSNTNPEEFIIDFGPS